MTPMLMIRLQRIGRTNDPAFRVVLTDRRNSPKSRNFVEILGTYNVQAGKTAFNAERIKYWISKGAKLSPTMHNFMVHEKIISGKKINVLSRKSPINPAMAESIGGVKKDGGDTPVAQVATDSVPQNAVAPEPKAEETPVV